MLIVLLKKQIIPTDFEETIVFFFNEQTILFLNERENERNRYKMDDHFENELHSL